MLGKAPIDNGEDRSLFDSKDCINLELKYKIDYKRGEILLKRFIEMAKKLKLTIKDGE